MNQDTKQKNTISRQAFYISLLIALTLGFLMGTAYTSFKLADSQQPGMRPMPPGMMGNTPKEKTASEPGAEGNKNPDLAAMAAPHIKKLQSFLKENPENTKAWIELGNAFFDIDRFEDAINAY